MTGKLHESASYFPLNCRELSANWESFRDLLCNLQCDNDTRLTLPGFQNLITRCRTIY